MFRVLITDPLSEQGIEKLQEASDVEVVQKTNLTPAELLTEVAEADALIVRSQTQVTAEVIEAGSRLKAVGLRQRHLDVFQHDREQRPFAVGPAQPVEIVDRFERGPEAVPARQRHPGLRPREDPGDGPSW